MSEDIFDRLQKSAFRQRFTLDSRDLSYFRSKGAETIREHARDFVARRLAPAEPTNDGKQTPMRGHPVFVAQHATATCCRGCLAKWHGMRAGEALSAAQQSAVVDVITRWLDMQVAMETPRHQRKA